MFKCEHFCRHFLKILAKIVFQTFGCCHLSLSNKVGVVFVSLFQIRLLNAQTLQGLCLEGGSLHYENSNLKFILKTQLTKDLKRK